MFRREPLSVVVNRALSIVAIVAVSVGASSTANSQEARQETLEEVVVTGSRIAADPNLVTSSPVTMVKSEELGFRGITRVEDLVNDLPSIVPELTANESNGATGSATCWKMTRRSVVSLAMRRFMATATLSRACGIPWVVTRSSVLPRSSENVAETAEETVGKVPPFLFYVLYVAGRVAAERCATGYLKRGS